MTMTIEEAARELAARLDITPPAGWPENIDSTKAEFRLSFGRLLQMSDLKTKLLELANNRTLRTRYPDGWHLPEESEVSESSQVDIAEAQAALEELGKKFVPEGIPLSPGAPDGNELPASLPQEKQAISGVDRNRIIAAFPPPIGTTPENWSKTLSSPPKWLSGARKCNGKPSVSALWNPAQFAMAYAEKGYMTKPNITVIINREFADWLPEWEKYTASFD